MSSWRDPRALGSRVLPALPKEVRAGAGGPCRPWGWVRSQPSPHRDRRVSLPCAQEQGHTP